MIDHNDIKFIFENPPDVSTGTKRGYTVGYSNGRKEIVTDEIGKSIAKVMSEKANREYQGRLVTPKGDPLQTVISTGIRIDQKAIDTSVIRKPR